MVSGAVLSQDRRSLLAESAQRSQSLGWHLHSRLMHEGGKLQMKPFTMLGMCLSISWAGAGPALCCGSTGTERPSALLHLLETDQRPREWNVTSEL